VALENIGPAENFPVGKAVAVEVDGKRYAVYNTTGQYYAIEDACPHAGGFFSDGTVSGNTATCPLHGATVDVRTGACTPPSPGDIEAIDVSCDSTDLFLHID
jgi:3-phenylpropionate/trans-cinnamate dioxygenase ferredoxin subunit